MFTTAIASHNQEVHLKLLKTKNVRLFVKREDEIHPLVSGNKFRKLKYNILEASNQKQHTLLTFGGAFSNHIVATAVAGNMSGLKTIGVIRGEELGGDLEKTLASNPSLKEAANHGMTFHFVTRDSYRNKTSEVFLASLRARFGPYYLVPEGGTNLLAVQGCEEILTEEDTAFNHVCVPVGTGGTIAGVIKAAKPSQQVWGFPALKGGFLKADIEPLLAENENWDLIDDYHFGGYAKYNDALIAFINEFKMETSIQLDPIYTGKMMFGIVDLIKKNYFSANSTILAIHTGGIQGIHGFNQRLAKKNKQLIRV